MTTPVIGEDCDIILIHPEVNGGDPYGFVLSPDPSKSGSAFSVQRLVNDDGSIKIYIFATILLADDLKNPDGSEHTDSRQTMYDMLIDFLAEQDGMSIATFIGTFMGIGQIKHTATELHLVDASYISLKFYNATTYHPPVDSDLFFASIWNTDPAPGGAYTWSISVWR